MIKKITLYTILCLLSVGLWAATDVLTFSIVVNDNPIDNCSLVDVPDTIYADDGPVTVKCLVFDPSSLAGAGASPLIHVDFGINLTNNSPHEDGWKWMPASFVNENGSGEEYELTVAVSEIPQNGQFYLLSRVCLPDSQWVYGAWDSNRNYGGKWDGTYFTAPLIQYIRESDIVDIPTDFALHAPYPNPFNPGTTIDFDIPEKTQLHVNVFDLKGKKVREIWNGTCNAGYHSRYIDMSDYASGIYIIQMITPEYRNVHKILLVK